MQSLTLDEHLTMLAEDHPDEPELLAEIRTLLRAREANRVRRIQEDETDRAVRQIIARNRQVPYRYRQDPFVGPRPVGV